MKRKGKKSHKNLEGKKSLTHASTYAVSVNSTKPRNKKQKEKKRPCILNQSPRELQKKGRKTTKEDRKNT